MTDNVLYQHLWKHSPPFQNAETFSYCKDARELRTSLSSGGRQATNSLSPSNREAVPSAQQSLHAPARWYRGARSGRGITVMSKPQDG